MNRWGSGATIGTIYRYERARDKHRIGHCDWKPKGGELCICVAHSGDSFFDYVAIRQRPDGKWIKVGEFSAYVFGAPVGHLNKRDFHLAQAGEPIDFCEREVK